MLSLRLLGSFEIASAGGASVHALLAQPKRAALLAYLAIADPPGFQRRDQLVALFWPEADTTRARRALNQALHHLRARLDPDVLLTRAVEEVGLNTERIECDVLALREALERGDLEAAVAWYRGPLLPGFHVQASHEFDDWLEQQRRALHTTMTTAARTLAERAAANGSLDVALHWSRRACELAPEDESCAQQLIRVLMRQGNEAGARLEVRRLRERLRRELDAEPSARTTSLLKSAAVVPEEGVPVVAPRPGDMSLASRQTRTLSGRAKFPLRRSRRLTVTASLMVVSFAAALVAADRSRRATGSEIPPAVHRLPRPVLLVADFDGPPRDTALGGIVTQLFLNGLQESRRARIVWSGELAAAMQRMLRQPGTGLHGALARELALREGFGAVLDGSVRELGGRLLVNAALVSPSDGHILWSGVGDAEDARALTSTIQSAVRSVRHVIGDPAHQIAAAPPLAQVVTPSLEALRAFTEAMHVPAQHRSRELLERAIALDTGFAAAYRSLGSALSFTSQQQRASEMLWKAVQHGDRLNDYALQNATAVLYSRGRYYDPDRALSAYDALLARDSSNVGTLRNAAWLLAGMGQLERAEALDERALRADSNAATLYGTLAGIRFLRGRATDGFRTLDTGIRRTGNANLLVLRAKARFLAGQTESIDTDLRRAVEASAVEDRPLVVAMAASIRASLARSLGQLDEAHRFDAERLRAARAVGDTDEVVRARLARVEELTWLLGDRAAALAELDQLRRFTATITGVDRPVPALASAFADAGRPDVAAALMREYERKVAPGEWRGTEPSRHAAWAHIALADGRARDAVQEFRTAAQDGCGGCTYFHLAVAHERAGMSDSAIAVGERFLDHAQLESVMSRGLHEPDMHRRLAALYLVKDDTVPAAQHLSAFINSWRGADHVLQPAVRAACRDLVRVRRHMAVAMGCR